MKIFKRIISIISMLFLLVPFVACGGKEEAGFEKGYYVLDSLEINGHDAMNEYLYYVINVKDEKNLEIKTCTIAGVTTEQCTYTASNDKVNIKIKRREYEYSYNDQAKTLSFTGKKGSEQEKSVFKYDKDFTFGESASGGVSFTKKNQKLWDDLEGVYNYCPTILLEGNKMHVWFCTDEPMVNNQPQFTDLIGYREGTLQPDGTWVFGEKSIAIYPGRKSGKVNQEEWDYAQCCDPSVVKGNFNYNGESYSYLMAYLGSKVYDAKQNETGLAVAKAPQGPWVKVNEGSETAFISYYNDENYVEGQWGIGQPSLISVDKQGKVLIFFSYDNGSLNTGVEYWDLSNLNNPIKLRDRTFLSDVGVSNPQAQDCMHNGDYSYDPVKNRIYVITDEFGDSFEKAPNGITGTSCVYYMQLDNNESFIGETLFNRSDYTWTPVQRLDTESTGFQKVHNCGLVTDAYGRNIYHDKLYVMYTVSIEASLNSKESVGSYRPYGWEISL